MGEAFVSELSIFPVKSLRGSVQAEAAVEPCGFAADRRWMVVDPAGRFMTQREHRLMALVQAAVVRTDATATAVVNAGAVNAGAVDAGAEILVLSTASGALISVPDAQEGELCQVSVWNDSVAARDCGDAAAAWLGAALGTACRLVHLADPIGPKRRQIRAAYADHAQEAVSFADGFPVLLTSATSLADLNARLDHPVPMLRFRPNLVISGAAAWEEDTWRRIRIGEAIFRIAKPCDRCIVTTIDPTTGLQPDGNEPLRTLSLFRRNTTGRVMFGQNLVPERCGTIRVGDTVEILQAAGSNVFFQ